MISVDFGRGKLAPCCEPNYKTGWVLPPSEDPEHAKPHPVQSKLRESLGSVQMCHRETDKEIFFYDVSCFLAG